MARRFLGAVLSVGVRIPLWVVVAVVLWLQLDKASAVRTAVNTAVAGLVHAAEIEATKAREEALLKIIEAQEQQARRDRAALAAFEQRLAAAQAERDSLYDEIAAMESMPTPDTCVVDDALIKRLRNHN